MKNLTKSNIVILLATIFSFVVIQILSFDRSFYLPLLLGIIKLGLVLFGIIYAIVKVRPKKLKLFVIVLLITIVYGTYQLSLWKISASLYINVVEDDYKEILKIVEKDSAFSTIFFRADEDTLQIWSNDKDEPILTIKEKEIIKSFMIEHSYIELWRIEYGIVFIYHRFIDNMGGLIYCPDPKIQIKMEADTNKYRLYDKVKENWYYHYRSG